MTYNLNNTLDSVIENDTTKYLLPDGFTGATPEFEEFWYEPYIESAKDYFSVYEWYSQLDTGKRSLSLPKTPQSIPDIDSSTSIKDLFSGIYLPKGVQSNDWITMQSEMRKSSSMTTSVRYHRHAYTVKAPFEAPLQDSFKGKICV